jgi:glycosyltransferase involved in cell wall biosynthesis
MSANRRHISGLGRASRGPIEIGAPAVRLSHRYARTDEALPIQVDIDESTLGASEPDRTLASPSGRLLMKSAVLVVPSTGDASGVVTFVSGLARALDPDSCVFAAPPGSDLERSLPDEARTLPCGPGRLEMTRFLATQGREFAVVQTHGARPLLAAAMGHLPRRALDHVFHEFPRATQRRSWVELGLAAGIRRTANTPALARRLARFGLPVSSTLAPLVSGDPPAPRDSARHALGIPPDALAGAVVGRLHRSKRPDLAVEATALLPADVRRTFSLYFLGEGPLSRSLARRGRRSWARIELRGHVAEASKLLAAFDVVVVPSPFETFSLTLAEAALAGVPIAAVASPGSRLITADGDLLPLASPTPEGLAERIGTALKHDGSQTGALREHVARHFTVENAGRAHREHFARLLAESCR